MLIRAESVLAGTGPEALWAQWAAMDLGEPWVPLVDPALEELPAGWDPQAAARAHPVMAGPVAWVVAGADWVGWGRVPAREAVVLQDRQGSRRDFLPDHHRGLRRDLQ